MLPRTNSTSIPTSLTTPSPSNSTTPSLSIYEVPINDGNGKILVDAHNSEEALENAREHYEDAVVNDETHDRATLYIPIELGDPERIEEHAEHTGLVNNLETMGDE